MNNINLGIIGLGNWGKVYLPKLRSLGVNFFVAQNNLDTLIEKKIINGLIISTPPSSHIQIAKYALDNNIPVMIEKPLALSHKEVEQLQDYNTPILVNNIHLFSNPYQYIKNNIDYSGIKGIQFINGNNGPVRNYSPLYDYGSHDFAMLIDLLGSDLTYLYGLVNKKENKEQYQISYSHHKIVCNLHIGNCFMKKQRMLKIITNDDVWEYDDTIQNKLKLNYENIEYDKTDHLTNAIKVFLNLIEGQEDKRSGIKLSLDVLKYLDYISNKLTLSYF